MRTVATFTTPTEAHLACAKLVSAGIEVTQFRVPDVRFSDHRPLVCDFRVDPDAQLRRSAA